MGLINLCSVLYITCFIVGAVDSDGVSEMEMNRSEGIYIGTSNVTETLQYTVLMIVYLKQ